MKELFEVAIDLKQLAFPEDGMVVHDETDTDWVFILLFGKDYESPDVSIEVSVNKESMLCYAAANMLPVLAEQCKKKLIEGAEKQLKDAVTVRVQ